MATVSTEGLTEFSLSMAEMADIPDAVFNDMLNAMADVIEPAQKRKGLAYGVHRTGVTISSIKRDKPRRSVNGGSITIRPQGLNAKGKSNAEVAFINEFGKRGQAPRPFIRDANEESADAAAEAAARNYDQWIKQKNL